MPMLRTIGRSGFAAGLLSLIPAAVFAHPGHGIAAPHDVLHGFMHPLHGADHLLAMVAVGLWAAQRSGRARWALPAAFVGAMIVGFVLGTGGIALPGAELAIAASVLVLGGVVALAVRMPAIGAATLVAAFALFHGHAHGVELPAAMAGAGFGAGFAASTALLHGAGIALALGVRTAVATRTLVAERLIGAGIAAAGIVLLLV